MIKKIDDSLSFVEGERPRPKVDTNPKNCTNKSNKINQEIRKNTEKSMTETKGDTYQYHHHHDKEGENNDELYENSCCVKITFQRCDEEVPRLGRLRRSCLGTRFSETYNDQ